MMRESVNANFHANSYNKLSGKPMGQRSRALEIHQMTNIRNQGLECPPKLIEYRPNRPRKATKPDLPKLRL